MLSSVTARYFVARYTGFIAALARADRQHLFRNDGTSCYLIPDENTGDLSGVAKRHRRYLGTEHFEIGYSATLRFKCKKYLLPLFTALLKKAIGVHREGFVYLVLLQLCEVILAKRYRGFPINIMHLRSKYDAENNNEHDSGERQQLCTLLITGFTDIPRYAAFLRSG